MRPKAQTLQTRLARGPVQPQALPTRLPLLPTPLRPARSTLQHQSSLHLRRLSIPFCRPSTPICRLSTPLRITSAPEATLHLMRLLQHAMILWTWMMSGSILTSFLTNNLLQNRNLWILIIEILATGVNKQPPLCGNIQPYFQSLRVSLYFIFHLLFYFFLFFSSVCCFQGVWVILCMPGICGRCRPSGSSLSVRVCFIK